MRYTNFDTIVPTIFETKSSDEVQVVVSNLDLFNTLQILKLHLGFQYKLLTCISGLDLMLPSYRFCVAYELLSLAYNSRLRLKVFLNEIAIVDSCVSIFINANWWEREIWDLYGFYFQNHPDLRRILTDYGFEGYPMRKDFPLSGFVEFNYDFFKGVVSMEAVELAQEYRFYN